MSAIAWTTVEAALVAWVRAGSGLSASAVRWAGQNFPQERPLIVLNVISVRPVGMDWVQTIANPLVIADDVVESVSAAANTLTLTGHAYLTGDGPLRGLTTGTLPAGWALATDVFAIKVDANTIKLASSLANAVATVPVPIDLTDAGTGTHTIVDTASTVRSGEEISLTARGQRVAYLSIQAFGGTVSGAASPRALLEDVVAHAALPGRRAALVAAGLGLAPLGAVQSMEGSTGASLFEPRATLEGRLFLTSEVSEPSTYIESVEITNEDTDDSFIVP